MFLIEEREAFETKYLKVFIRNPSQVQKIVTLIEELQSVRKVNIVDDIQKGLTVYSSKTYSRQETKVEIELALNAYFSGNPIDPVFTKSLISSISDKAYFDILDRILIYGHNLEKYKDLYAKFDEEGFRDFFLPHLNSISQSHTATGETFNKIGKTDILIQDQDGKNVFIAECKLWKGEGELIKAIDQLLGRYVTWRDEKVALIIFNRAVKGFSDLIHKAVEGTSRHLLCDGYLGGRSDTSHSFIFQHPDDKDRKINLELIMFNCT